MNHFLVDVIHIIGALVLYNNVNIAIIKVFFIENMIKKYQNALLIVRATGKKNNWLTIVMMSKGCAMDA